MSLEKKFPPKLIRKSSESKMIKIPNQPKKSSLEKSANTPVGQEDRYKLHDKFLLEIFKAKFFQNALRKARETHDQVYLGLLSELNPEKEAGELHLFEGDILGIDKSNSEAWYAALCELARKFGCDIQHGEDNPNELYLIPDPSYSEDATEYDSEIGEYLTRLMSIFSDSKDEYGYLKKSPQVIYEILAYAPTRPIYIQIDSIFDLVGGCDTEIQSRACIAALKKILESKRLQMDFLDGKTYRINKIGRDIRSTQEMMEEVSDQLAPSKMTRIISDRSFFHQEGGDDKKIELWTDEDGGWFEIKILYWVDFDPDTGERLEEPVWFEDEKESISNIQDRATAIHWYQELLIQNYNEYHPRQSIDGNKVDLNQFYRAYITYPIQRHPTDPMEISLRGKPLVKEYDIEESYHTMEFLITDPNPTPPKEPNQPSTPSAPENPTPMEEEEDWTNEYWGAEDDIIGDED